jgi:CDP-diacylglycerol--glycerol-3-phosphate 3-phosphatidyltransferase
MAPVLWVLAVLSTITIIHRIAYTYQQTRIIDLKAAEAAAAQQANAASKGDSNKPQPAKGKGPQQIPSFN